MVAARRVLVVDDEPVVNESCRRVLTREGYEVDTAQSGREGLDRALAADFDLVITDLKMPDLDGMDAPTRPSSSSRATAPCGPRSMPPKSESQTTLRSLSHQSSWPRPRTGRWESRKMNVKSESKLIL